MVHSVALRLSSGAAYASTALASAAEKRERGELERRRLQAMHAQCIVGDKAHAAGDVTGIYLAQKGYRVVGFDFSAEAIEIAVKRASDAGPNVPTLFLAAASKPTHTREKRALAASRVASPLQRRVCWSCVRRVQPLTALVRQSRLRGMATPAWQALRTSRSGWWWTHSMSMQVRCGGGASTPSSTQHVRRLCCLCCSLALVMAVLRRIHCLAGPSRPTCRRLGPPAKLRTSYCRTRHVAFAALRWPASLALCAFQHRTFPRSARTCCVHELLKAACLRGGSRSAMLRPQDAEPLRRQHALADTTRRQLCAAGGVQSKSVTLLVSRPSLDGGARDQSL